MSKTYTLTKTGKSKKGTFDIYTVDGSTWRSWYEPATSDLGDRIQIVIEKCPASITITPILEEAAR